MKIICWWSGGVTSAVACYLATQIWSVDRCEFIMIDTYNEDYDTYRFKRDCEQKLYGKEIKTISNKNFTSIQEVWEKSLSLNVANGAICSAQLKRNVRKKWETANKGTYERQIFGFDIDEPKRAKSMALNYPNAFPTFPLLLFGLSKKQCITLLNDLGIDIPRTYKLGFHNNNCFQTGCVQGGIGYWQKIQREYPKKFDKMAEMEHRLTDKKGQPVTMLRNQAKEGGLIFLKPHPKYPEIISLKDKKAQKVKPLFECNGFCSTNDLLPKNETAKEINYQEAQIKLFTQ